MNDNSENFFLIKNFVFIQQKKLFFMSNPLGTGIFKTSQSGQFFLFMLRIGQLKE